MRLNDFLLIMFPSIAIVLLTIGASIAQVASTPSTTTITVYNPYRLTVNLEVKCDWDYKKQQFDYLKHFTVPGKKNTEIVVPNRLKKCQVWPKISW